MKTVRHQTFGGPEVLSFENLPGPKSPQGDQVVVACRVSGVNFADTLKRRNLYPLLSDGGLGLDTGIDAGVNTGINTGMNSLAPVSLVPGFEASGVVQSVGENVVGFMPGDRVLVLVGGGCYADYVTVSQRNVYALPDEITFEQAVCLPYQGLTAYFMLLEALTDRTLPSVLVHAAAGGVGLFAVQLARLMGAGNIVGTVGSLQKADLLKDEGFAEAVVYTDHDWPERALAANGNAPYDLILDSVGGAVLSNSFSLLAPGGQVTVFGRTSGEAMLFDPVDLIMKNQAVRGFSLQPYASRHDLVEEGLLKLFDFVREDRLKPIITGRFALSQAAYAHKLMEERRTTGKIVLSADLDGAPE